mmetsp:Transcript_74434/g.197723  ORF Transcript_74434/g.197723 Transcript_74434/m.197723 type:complete len:264 (-) Transcript_74434:84-875(-)
MAAAPAEGARLVALLRERLLRGLNELAACRELLDSHGIFCDTAFGARPEDHSDVLECQLRGAEGALGEGAGTEPLDAGAVARLAAGSGAAPSTPSSTSSARGPSAAPASAAGHGALTAATAAQAQLAPGAGLEGSAVDTEERLRCENLEEELSMAKALLMLNNVTLHMDFNQDEAGAGAASAAQVVRLKGSRHLIQLLITLKQKVSLLNQQYLLLRGDMLYLSHEMSVCRHWILQSFRAAMQHQFNEHSSLQTRFERLSKVLN